MFLKDAGILRSRDPSKLEIWIVDAVNSGLVAIERFARALRRDVDAVCNAVELPWSNGQAESQINRLKTIKRLMYGRAGPEFLRVRMPPLNQHFSGRFWGCKIVKPPNAPTGCLSCDVHVKVFLADSAA